MLDAEVAGKAAAALDRDNARTRPRQQGGVGIPAEHGGVVAVRLRDDHGAGQVGRLPVGGRRQELRERVDPCGEVGHSWVVDQLGRVAAPHGHARRLEPDDRGAGCDDADAARSSECRSRRAA